MKKVSPRSNNSQKVPSLHQVSSFELTETVVGATKLVSRMGKRTEQSRHLRNMAEASRFKTRCSNNGCTSDFISKVQQVFNFASFLREKGAKQRCICQSMSKHGHLEFYSRGRWKDADSRLSFWACRERYRQFWVWTKSAAKCEFTMPFWPQKHVYFISLSLIF